MGKYKYVHKDIDYCCPNAKFTMDFDRDYVQMVHDDILYGICSSRYEKKFLGIFFWYRKLTRLEQLKAIKGYVKHMESFEGIEE